MRAKKIDSYFLIDCEISFMPNFGSQNRDKDYIFLFVYFYLTTLSHRQLLDIRIELGNVNSQALGYYGAEFYRPQTKRRNIGKSHALVYQHYDFSNFAWLLSAIKRLWLPKIP